MQYRNTNALIHETSPYLLQHAHNPVNWYPWGEQALSRAREENKLMLVSIGYAACHWCHVMERESFESPEVAEIMNAHFICIKVDREERPDIDQIYMDAVMLMTGHGGWPLNCFTLPDGRPVFGGTYFPRDRWINVLQQLVDMYQSDKGRFENYAQQLTEGIESLEGVIPPDESEYSFADLEGMTESWKDGLDLRDGGMARAPKFPMPSNWLFLMRAAFFMRDEELSKAVGLTLHKMAYGGIYDAIGGGFARYSTDMFWKVPHFEKMLYDNAQLISLYSEAYTLDPNPLYKTVVYETIAWIKREMTDTGGGIYSSLDADSEGVEGKFYIWKQEEISEVLGPDAVWFCEYYNVSPQGNWEHGNSILFTRMAADVFALKHGMTPESFDAKLNAAKSKLLQARSARVRPGLDDKQIAGWNGLMAKAFADAYKAFGETSFREDALRTAAFIESNLRDGDRLWRSYKAGRAAINAFLDDYALVAESYLELHEITLDPVWLRRALSLCDYVLAHFSAPDSPMLFYTSDLDPPLITRKKEIMDNVIPGACSVMANVFFRLALYTDRMDLKERAFSMLREVKTSLPGHGPAYSNWGTLLLKFLFPHYEVVVTGENAEEAVRKIFRHYAPNKVISGGVTSTESDFPILSHRFTPGETLMYICQAGACHLPVRSVQDALEQLQYHE